jgi:hypothetical protein
MEKLLIRDFYILKGLIFDLGDSSRWEYMLPSNDKPILKVPDIIDTNDEDEVLFKALTSGIPLLISSINRISFE